MKLRAVAVLVAVLLAACSKQSGWHATDITGAMPPLVFTMTRASDGEIVSEADYRGKIVVLYFGYTHCPDICPTTLANLAEALGKLGAKADGVRVLFVTVDPNRDTPDLMKGYVNSFAPQVNGLRGTDDQLAALARRYRVAYTVTPGPNYEVMHSNAVFFFGRDGRAHLVSTDTKDIGALTEDLNHLLDM
ncbi:MAG: SCO family protein [Alphaproteobacteria bacterium]|nr:SCO family protein [Alphaproteobacteria bacterium]MBL6939117.1 SCO family protein [Alphaproteobacteria bacterium]MBL7096634.1 SCO family protein [Alphaproteobacteria bacterium]